VAVPLPYSYSTLADSVNQLAARLYLSQDNVTNGTGFWTAAELRLYIVEALQTWNSYAQYWRGDFTFHVATSGMGWGEGGYSDGGYGGGGSGSSTWYDLTQVANTLRPYTVTDVDLYTIMEYHLLEPPSGVTWTGTGQFNINDLMAAVQRRRDEILNTTGCAITLSTLPYTPAQPRNYLNDSILDVRRIAWFPKRVSSADTAVPNVLWPEDVWSFESFEDGYTTFPEGIPTSYAMSSQPPLSFDVDTVPQQPGVYELLTVNAGTALTTTQPTLMPIPADFCYVLKWGALADLFSKEAEAKDELRAAYCNKRYQQGMQLLSSAPAVLQLRINNVPTWIDAVRGADEYATDWQSFAAGVPVNTFTAGLNLIALSPPPDATGYTVTATVVQNAPIPVAPGDFVQVARGDYDAVIDYAQHLALVKNGGSEFSATKELYARFVRQAALYNSKLHELGCFQEELYGTSQREEVMNPRMAKTTEGGQS
jgi:hypothetical protein